MKGDFVVLANVFYNLRMFIREASCSPAISGTLRPEVEKIRAELEASNAKEQEARSGPEAPASTPAGLRPRRKGPLPHHPGLSIAAAVR